MNLAWVAWREQFCSSSYLVQKKSLEDCCAECQLGLQRQRGAFFLEACGCFRSTMNAAAEGLFSPQSGRFGPGPHSDGCFFRGMLPVLRPITALVVVVQEATVGCTSSSHRGRGGKNEKIQTHSLHTSSPSRCSCRAIKFVCWTHQTGCF